MKQRLHPRVRDKLLILTLLELQSRCGDKTLEYSVVCPRNETAVLKGLHRNYNWISFAEMGITLEAINKSGSSLTCWRDRSSTSARQRRTAPSLDPLTTRSDCFRHPIAVIHRGVPAALYPCAADTQTAGFFFIANQSDKLPSSPPVVNQSSLIILDVCI